MLTTLTVSFNFERGPDDGKQCGVKEHRAVRVERHVHGDESLTRHAVRAQFPETCILIDHELRNAIKLCMN